MRRPNVLEPGARVALIAPAGPLRDEEDLHQAEENVRRLGCDPRPGQYVLARRGFLAGHDEERLADLNEAARDPAIDAVWCLRGGYGTMRLLEGVDYDAWRRTAKPLVGYSDITALHAAIGARAGLVTFHGPTARATLSDFSLASLSAALRGDDSCGALSAPEARPLAPGRARGPLVGGNLALLAALAGTPYAPSYDGAIIVVEDVGEPLYRIDRMLTQLRLSGAFSRCAGIVFGAFTEIPADGGEATLDEVLEDAARAADVPCVTGAPVGHIADQWTLPLGAMAELDADALTLAVTG